MLGVIGVGAIGGVCAAELAHAGTPVVGCVRRRAPGLRLDAPAHQIEPRIAWAVDPSQRLPFAVEWFLLATKAHQTPAAMAWFDAWAEAGTYLAVLQNGVEHASRVAPWVARDRVVEVVVECPATAVAPGHIVQRRPARFSVPPSPGARAFAALFAATEIEVSIDADWTTCAWQKLCQNVVGGALAALAGRRVSEIDHPQKSALARALAEECARVARAEGARISDAWLSQLVDSQSGPAADGQPSTLTDRLAGRPIEADARNAAVPRIGKRHGIEAPVNERAAALMLAAHQDPHRDWLPELAKTLP